MYRPMYTHFTSLISSCLYYPFYHNIGPDVNILMYYDQEASALFSTFNYHFQVLKMKREVKHRVVSHDSSVTEAIYNEKYGHVISVDESSCVTIWFLNTGQKVCIFGFLWFRFF